jgi:hypothetical protein
MFFYDHLSARRYPRQYLAAVFGEITWKQRSQIQNCTTKKNECFSFFKTYWSVSSPSKTHWSGHCSKKDRDLRLKELIQSTYWDIFPPFIKFS